MDLLEGLIHDPLLVLLERCHYVGGGAMRIACKILDKARKTR